MASKLDYYAVLGVSKDAAEEEIKRSYRKLALQHHPDRNPGNSEAEIKFKEVAEAWSVLGDAEKRRAYDRYGHAGLNGMGMPDFGDAENMADMFDDLIGGFFGGRGGRRGGRRGPRRGDDLQVDVQLDLVEAFRGVRKTIQLRRDEVCRECAGRGSRRGTEPSTCKRCGGQGVVFLNQGFFRLQQTCPGCGGHGKVITDPCPVCHGRAITEAAHSVDVQIPPGVMTGHGVPVQGEGRLGDPGAPRGDLIVRINVREHPLFHRDGPHLICQVPITFSQAALGAELEVPALDGVIKQTIKRGTQSGDVIRLTGRGMPDVRSGRRGDLLVQMLVETPKSLTKRQEELLRELAELEQKHVQPQRKSFLDKLKDFFNPVAEKKDEGKA